MRNKNWLQMAYPFSKEKMKDEKLIVTKNERLDYEMGIQL